MSWLANRKIKAYRTLQRTGRHGDADVVVEPLPFLHAEVKRAETAHVYKWLNQATEDAKKGQLPVVFHRQNNRAWVAMVDAGYMLDCLVALGMAMGLTKHEKGDADAGRRGAREGSSERCAPVDGGNDDNT